MAELKVSTLINNLEREKEEKVILTELADFKLRIGTMRPVQITSTKKKGENRVIQKNKQMIYSHLISCLLSFWFKSVMFFLFIIC